MIKTLGNNIVNAFTGGNPVKAIYTYGQLVWPTSPVPTEYYIKWTPSSAEGQFNIDGTTYDLSAFSGLYYWSTGIINSRAFEFNDYIQSIETNATSIGDWAFHYCDSLSQVSLPMCGYIGVDAFFDCRSLKQVSLPVCSYIGSYAFQDCHSLSKISLPVCESIEERAFGFCSSLKQVSLPVCSYIGVDAFSSCRSLSQISLPMCSYIGTGAFLRCISLSQISLPTCESIGYIAFLSCWSLAQASLPVCSYIGEYAFYNCYSLSRITIGYSGVCSLDGTSVFDGTKITSSRGSIYVPASLVNSYKKATNWSYYSRRIFPIKS